MRVVHKFAIARDDLNDDGFFDLTLPADARVLLVSRQMSKDELPTLWIELEESAVRQKQIFLVLPTGEWVPEWTEHVGSAVCADGALVWHIYRDRS